MRLPAISFSWPSEQQIAFAFEVSSALRSLSSDCADIGFPNGLERNGNTSSVLNVIGSFSGKHSFGTKMPLRLRSLLCSFNSFREPSFSILLFFQRAWSPLLLPLAYFVSFRRNRPSSLLKIRPFWLGSQQ